MNIVIVDDTQINVTLMQALVNRIEGCEPICFTDSGAACGPVPAVASALPQRVGRLFISGPLPALDPRVRSAVRAHPHRRWR